MNIKSLITALLLMTAILMAGEESRSLRVIAGLCVGTAVAIIFSAIKSSKVE